MSDEELDRLRVERDRLQARLEDYEGDLEAWEIQRAMMEQSSLGAPDAERYRSRAPLEVGKAIMLGSEYLRRAEKAEAEVERLRALLGEIRGQWEDVTLLDDEDGHGTAIDRLLRSLDARDVMGDSDG